MKPVSFEHSPASNHIEPRHSLTIWHKLHTTFSVRTAEEQDLTLGQTWPIIHPSCSKKENEDVIHFLDEM